MRTRAVGSSGPSSASRWHARAGWRLETSSTREAPMTSWRSRSDARDEETGTETNTETEGVEIEEAHRHGVEGSRFSSEEARASRETSRAREGACAEDLR